MSTDQERRTGLVLPQVYFSCNCGRNRVVVFPNPSRELCPRRPDYSECDLCGKEMEQVDHAQFRVNSGFAPRIVLPSNGSRSQLP